MNNHDTDIGKQILQTLKEKDRSIAWLAKRLDYDKSNLTKMLKNGKYIHYDLIYKISKALEEDFFVYGSQKLKDS